MEDFKKPKRGAYRRFLFIDRDEAVDVLSSIEGGTREEILTRVAEEHNKGGELSGKLGYGPAGIGGKGSKKALKRYEEEVRLKSTDHSVMSSLLKELHERGAIDKIPAYTPDIYDQIDEGELYEFEAEIRIHPLHQLVTVTRGWAEFGDNLGMSKMEVADFTKMAGEMERAFQGKNKAQRTLALFAVVDEADPEYRIAMPIKVDQLWVPIDELSGRATFVAQVERKLGEDDQFLAARMVRNAPVLPAERKMMLDMLPAFQTLPGQEDLGIELEEEDVVLSKPAVLMKPLCIYRG